MCCCFFFITPFLRLPMSLHSASSHNHSNRALGTNIIKTLSATELRTMTPDQVDLLFRHVDLDGNGRLSRAELRQLCAVMVARISELMKEYMVSRMPHASPEQIERAVAEERAFLLPRAHSVDGGQGNSSRMTEEDWTKHMLAHLLAKLDVNDDGVVSKFEFSDTWNKVAASVFNIEGGHGSNDRNGCAQQ